MDDSTENKTESLPTNKDEATNQKDSSSPAKEETTSISDKSSDTKGLEKENNSSKPVETSSNKENATKSVNNSNNDPQSKAETKTADKPLEKSNQKPNKKPVFNKKPLPKAKAPLKNKTFIKPKKKKNNSFLKFLFFLFIVAIIVLGVFAYNKGIENYSLIKDSIKYAYTPIDNPDSDFARNSSKYHDNFNFPEYAKQFMPDEKLYEEISKIDTFIPRGKNIGNPFLEDELYEIIKKIIPSNINDYKTVLVPLVKSKMAEKKEKSLISYTEGATLPYSPDMKTFRNTLRYWNLVSRYYIQRRDYDTSLLIIHGIFYVSRELITKYNSSGFFSHRLVYQICNSVACDSILNWASIPRLNSQKLAKMVAIDILDLVENDYSFSNNVIYERAFLEKSMESALSSFAKGRLLHILQTQEYKDMVDLFFKKPLDYVDKPIFETKSNFDELDKDINNIVDKYDLSTDNIPKFLTNLFKNKEMIIAYNFFKTGYPNIRSAKEKHEENLAKMEFSAIALAINAFYCERSRLPSSIGELGNWLNKDLPNNRLTNQPYKLNLDGDYLLTNEAVSEEDRYYFKLTK